MTNPQGLVEPQPVGMKAPVCPQILPGTSTMILGAAAPAHRKDLIPPANKNAVL